MVIGLTGGMGCGKSTAARHFAARDCRLIDSDAVIRKDILRRPEVITLARERWGDEVVDGAGQLDRTAVARHIFGDDGERQVWEAEIHPRLFAHWRELLHSDRAATWVIEVPLLFEQQLENWFDFIVCVASSPDIQLARLTERGVSQELASQRISKQLPLARKIEMSDVVLWNDGTTDFLEQQIDQVLASLNFPPAQN